MQTPSSHAEATDRGVPTAIAVSDLRNKTLSPTNVENAKHLIGSISGATIIAPIITAALLESSPSVAILRRRGYAIAQAPTVKAK